MTPEIPQTDLIPVDFDTSTPKEEKALGAPEYKLVLEYIEEYQKPFRDMWDVCDQLVEGYQDIIKDPWRNTTRVPLSYTALWSMVPRHLQAVLACDPPFEVLPTNAASVVNALVVLEGLTHFWDVMPGKISVLTTVIEQCYKRGTTAAKMTWEASEREVIHTVEKTSPMFSLFGMNVGEKKETVQQTDVVYEFVGPKIFYRDIKDIFVYPSVSFENVPDAPLIADRMVVNLDEYVADMESKGYSCTNLEEAYKSEMDSNDIDTSVDFLAKMGKNVPDKKDDEAVENKIKVVFEIYDRRHKTFVSLVNRQVIIHERPWHGRYPILWSVNVPVGGQLYGGTEIYRGKDLEFAATSTRRQRLDAMSMAMNDMWLINTNAEVSNFVSAPGVQIKTNDMNAVKKLDVASNANQSQFDEMNFVKDHNDVTGVNEFMRGAMPTGAVNETSSGLQQMSDQYNIKLFLKLRVFQETFMAELVKLMFSLIQEFSTPEMLISALGENGPVFRTIPIEALNQQYNFKINTDVNLGDLEKRKMVARQYTALFMQILPPQDKAIWIQYLLKLEGLDKLGLGKSGQLPGEQPPQVPPQMTPPGQGEAPPPQGMPGQSTGEEAGNPLAGVIQAGGIGPNG